MKKIIILFLLNIPLNSWGLDLDILSIRMNENNLLIDIEINTNQEILLPQNILQDYIYLTNDPLGREIPIFSRCLKVNNRGNLSLVLSNEINGVLDYCYAPTGDILHTINEKYISFIGKTKSTIQLSKISSISVANIDTTHKSLKIDEVCLEICFSTNMKLKNKRPLDFSNFIENEINLIICPYRLKEPITINNEMIIY